jgi:hypothetical protein
VHEVIGQGTMIDSPCRRNVLTCSLGAVTAAFLGHTARAADTRAAPVIDTHTHFYDPTRPQGVPWPGKGDAFLYRPVLPAEWKALVGPLGMTSRGNGARDRFHATCDWPARRNAPALPGLQGDFDGGLDGG